MRGPFFIKWRPNVGDRELGAQTRTGLCIHRTNFATNEQTQRAFSAFSDTNCTGASCATGVFRNLFRESIPEPRLAFISLIVSFKDRDPRGITLVERQPEPRARGLETRILSRLVQDALFLKNARRILRCRTKEHVTNQSRLVKSMLHFTFSTDLIAYMTYNDT